MDHKWMICNEDILNIKKHYHQTVQYDINLYV